MAYVDFAPHNMTTELLPTPYVAAESSYYIPSLKKGYLVFDGGLTTEVWVGINAGVDWVSLDIGSGNTKKLYSYSIYEYSASNTRFPNTWTMEGSNDNTNWTTLDTRSGITWAGGGGARNKKLCMRNLYYRL